MSIEALKEQARKEEQNEDWGAALQVYVEAINRQGEDDHPDLGLYNRAGDLSTRLGDAVGAIQYYEQAVELYLEAELPNNAIAILKKILRNLPDRSEVFLRMGQIRARQGFLTDARNNFLTYAERQQRDGQMDEAFRALEEFADLAPEDVEVRLALVDQLQAHERSGEALRQLSLVYHQYTGRGESDAAAGIERRIQEIDSAFVIPDLDESGGAFETNVLGGDAAEIEGTVNPDDPVEAAFEEIAFDDADDIALTEPAALALDSSEEASLDLDEDSSGLDEDKTEDEDDAFDFSAAEEALAFDDVEEGSDEALGSDLAADEPLEFGVAVFGVDDGSPGAEDRGTLAHRADGVEPSDDEPLAEQDDWDVGADIEDAFISFESPEAQAQDSEADQGLSTEPMEGSTEEPAVDPVDEHAELELVSDSDSPSTDGLPLIGFDGIDETFDGEAPETEVETESEPATTVALEGDFDSEAEVADLGWSTADVEPEADAGASDEDELWTAVPSAESEDSNEASTELEAAADPQDEDEWIGLAADDGEPVQEAVAEDTPESVDDIDSDEATTPSLVDFEAYSLSDLREYVTREEGVAPAWERIGRLALEQGETDPSQEAFEEAHLAYAHAEDYMSAMRCVRELLLGEPDQVEYHQRLVEYAHRADDRTLLVSGYLELADCLIRTGAPAKARAVHTKVLDIDPTNRRAAAALGEEGDSAAPATDDAEAGYVDLGSMVIERGEKTTRWTVEAEEPAGEADFDFQNMLAQFKAKVAENVDIDDVKAHYDLGTAYKEMGLVDEAITEFQAALRADGQNLATFEMLGRCFMDKGQPEVAIRSLTRATEMPFDVEDELLGIYYFLGRAHEELSNRDDAVEYYEKIFALDINFEDVTERLRALR